MSTSSLHRPRLGSTRVIPLVVAGAVVIGGVAAAVVLTDDRPSAAGTMELTVPASNVAGSCVVYSVDTLAQMPTAFSGRVRETGGGSVVLAVDAWYRGGSGDAVRLTASEGEMTSIDGVDFVPGERYLVTASETGTVNACGYTAEWTPEMAADFAAAFGG